MKKTTITQNQILSFFWNNDSFYNRCYIYRPYNNMLYLQFENPIKLEHIVERFNAYCKQINVDGSLAIIEHRGFVRGRLTTDLDYIISLPI